MPDFDVRYGDSDKQPDWRHFEDPGADDDEPLEKTPASVIEMLGFDPLDETEPRYELRTKDGYTVEDLGRIGLEAAKARAYDVADERGEPVRLVEVP